MNCKHWARRSFTLIELFLFITKREMLHVVITGRTANPELIAVAYLATERKVIKHPYSRGTNPQPGVEF